MLGDQLEVFRPYDTLPVGDLQPNIRKDELPVLDV